MALFKVLKPVGPHLAGEFIEVCKEHIEKGVDTARLVALGAVEEVEDAGGALVTKIGYPQDPNRTVALIPPVPASAEPVSAANDADAAKGKGK